jgi:epoxyqueuosine reductase QueG
LEEEPQSLARAKELNERHFDSRSTINRPLLEIQDAFRQEKERVRQLVEKQRLRELEYHEQVRTLQKTLMLLSLLFLVIIGVIFYYSLPARHRAEKELMEKKRELEARQAEERIELSNKELTTSALKLIGKDELLATLKKDLSGKEGEVSASDIKRAIKTISVSNTQNWHEFEALFEWSTRSFTSSGKRSFRPGARRAEAVRADQAEFFEQGHRLAVGDLGGQRAHHPAPVTEETEPGARR